MFAILRKAMEPSPVCRPSPSISPTLLPPLDDSPPPLLPYFKVEKQEDRESPIKEHRESPDPDHNENKDEDSPVKFEPRDDQTDSQMLKQRLEMYWKGMMKYHEQLQPEVKEAEEAKTESEDNEVKTEPMNRALKQNLAALSAHHRLQPQKNGRNGHASTFVPVTSDVTSMPQSFLSQQTLAAMFSLQQMQRQQHQLLSSKNTTLPNLLPPAPSFPATTSGALPRPINSNITDKQPHFTSPPRHTMASTLPPTSVLNPFNHIKPISKSPQPDNNDMPLDLSLSASGNKRFHDGILKPSSTPSHRENKFQSAKDRKKLDDTALSSIQSNFPTLLNSNRAQARAAQQAMLTAHIKNGLSNDSVPVSTGPFTSLYQKQENVTPPNGPNLNDLMQGGVQPLQIQQWLMAAVSAQKMQQLALSHISMLQQQQQQQQAVSHPDPPQKRPKLTDTPRLYSSLPQLPLPTISQQQPLFPQPLTSHTPENRTFTPNSHPPTNRRSPKASSPTLSPDSNQSQSGKRYRRYAKPPYSYVSLITLSILSARDKKLRLSQILKRISEMFPFFNGSYQGWRDSVRHNLSQNECFVKVLKNPFRPTAKGNFWTVNLNSIPHELLLRQNTLVSRYAQDSGYRYRKDLSEVFDLRTGALKVSVPRHLLRDTSDPNASALSDDPAAVMEALLLVETSDDDTNDYKEKIAPEVRQFTLEDLFHQGDGGDEDSFSSSGRNRGRNKQSTHAMSHPPTLLPASFAQTLYHTANPALSMSNGIPTTMHNRSADVQNLLAMGMLPQGMLSQSVRHSPQMPMALSEGAPNPFAAAQTALLSKALAATQLQGFDSLPSLQKMLYANRALQKQSFEPPVSTIPLMKTPTPPIPTAVSPIPKRATPSPQHHDLEDNNDHNALSDGSTSSKKHKRKAVHPTRHAGNSDVTSYQNGMGNGSTSPRNAFVVPAMSRASSTPSRNISSEADSTSNPFCSPVTSSSTKSHSSTSPRHDVSSEFEDNRHPPHTIYNAQPANGISSFQALQMFGASSLQASKMA